MDATWADAIFKCNSINENVSVIVKIPLNFVPKATFTYARSGCVAETGGFWYPRSATAGMFTHSGHWRICHLLRTRMVWSARFQIRRGKLGVGPICCGAGPWFNIKMSSYQYRKSHCGDKTVVRSSYLHSGISYTGKMTFLYWFSPQILLPLRLRSATAYVWTHVMICVEANFPPASAQRMCERTFRVELIISDHWRQAITWTNDDPVWWRIYVSPGLNELLVPSH